MSALRHTHAPCNRTQTDIRSVETRGQSMAGSGLMDRLPVPSGRSTAKCLQARRDLVRYGLCCSAASCQFKPVCLTESRYPSQITSNKPFPPSKKRGPRDSSFLRGCVPDTAGGKRAS
jgi:hypothetical protein